MARLRIHLLAFLWTGIACAQSNDAFTDAVSLEGYSVSAIATAGTATKEAGEPNHAGTTGGKSVWWTWTARENLTLNFSAFASEKLDPSQPAPALAIYTGDFVDALTEVGSDAGPTSRELLEGNLIRTGASVDVSTVQGQVYRIAVDAPLAGGAVTLNIGQPPIIVSAATCLAIQGEAFNYTVQASNRPKSFGAEGLPEGLSIHPSTGVISGNPLQAGIFPVTVQATNSNGQAEATVMLTVDETAAQSGGAPVITSAAARRLVGDEPFSYRITATGSPTSYGAEGLPKGLAINSSTGEISGSPFGHEGEFRVWIWAANSSGTTTALLTLHVSGRPRAPVLTSDAIVSATLGKAFSYQIETDNNSAPARATTYHVYGLPPGFTLDEQTGVIQGVPQHGGHFDFWIEARNVGGSGTGRLTVNVAEPLSPEAEPLLIQSAAQAAGTVGEAFTYQLKTNKADVQFQLRGEPPAGLSLNEASGYLTGVPREKGTFEVAVSALGEGQSVEAALTIVITAPAASPTQAPPLIKSSLCAVGYVGESFSYYADSSSWNGGSNSSQYAASGLPAGLGISSPYGMISGTPTAEGIYPAEVSVTAPTEFGVGGLPAGTGTATITFLIRSARSAPSTPPLLTSALKVNGAVGVALDYRVTAAGDGVSFSGTGLPDGLSLDASGEISGQPTTTGVYNVTFAATNGAGSDSAKFLFYIAPTPAAPIFTSDATASGTVGSPFTHALTATPAATFNAWDLPEGLTLTGNIITGTPTTPGSFAVPISATNTGGRMDAVLTITIEGLLAPEILNAAAVEGTVGDAFSTYISALNSPTNYTAEDLPAGLGFDSSTGRISGTPVQEGEFRVPVTAENAGGVSHAVLTLRFRDGSKKPIITSPSQVAVTAGEPISYTIAATNSPTEYGASHLPAGLAVDGATGVISGTPTAKAGSYVVQVFAGNPWGRMDTEIRIVILKEKGEIVFTSPAAAGGYVGSPFAYKIKAANVPAGLAVQFTALPLPPGLKLDSKTGQISGIPQSQGTFKVRIATIPQIGPGASVTITIRQPTAAPMINSSAGALARAGEPFSYTITADNGPTSFEASGLPGGLTLDPKTGVISGTIAKSSNAYAVARVPLSASNAKGRGQSQLTLTIAPNPEVFTNSAGAAAVVGTPFTFTPVSSHASNSEKAIGGLPPGLKADSKGVITGTPTQAGVYTVSLRDTGGPATGVLTIEVGASAVQTPVITSSAGAAAYRGEAFLYRIATANPATSFGAAGLPNGLSLDGKTGVISGTPMKSGRFITTLSATNTSGTSTAKLTISIPNGVPGRVTSSASVEAFVGTALNYKVEGTPPPLQYYQESNLPPGLSFGTNAQEPSSFGVLQGIPTGEAVSYDFHFLSIFDPQNFSPISTVVTVIVRHAAVSAPVITSSASVPGYRGVDFKYKIEASNRPTKFGAEEKSLPAGLTFDPTTGIISGRLENNGVFSIPITAENAIGICTATLTVVATSPPPPPLITNAAAVKISVGRSIAYAIQAANSPEHFEAYGLPNGLTIDRQTGVVSGVARESAGEYRAEIYAANEGGSTYASVKFVVDDTPLIPRIFSRATADGVVGGEFSYSLAATESPTSYGVSEGDLPRGLVFDPGTGRIFGTPLDGGMFQVLVTAQNEFASGSAVLTISIAAAPARPQIHFAKAAVSGTVGHPFRYGIFAHSSVSGFPVSYYFKGVPPGLAYDPTTGTISGTPTETGDYRVSLHVGNAAGDSSAETLIRIGDAPAPEIRSAASVEGYVGSSLSYLIPTDAPATFTASNLPPGLKLNPKTGLIFGVPAEDGFYPASVTATNAQGTRENVIRFQIRPDAEFPPVLTSAATVRYPDDSFGGLFERSGFYYRITATNGPQAFGAELPEGLAINPATGEISGLPQSNGTFRIPVSASNKQGSQTAVFTLIVSNETSELAPPASLGARVGEAFSYPLAGSSVTNARFAATGLPPGLGLDADTGAIAGVPTKEGSYPAALSKVDGSGESRVAVTFVVGPALPDHGEAQLFIDVPMARAGTVGVPLQYDLRVRGGAGLFKVSGLPEGLSFAVLDEVLRISGTPTRPGNFEATIHASNQNGSSTLQQTFVIAHEQEPAPFVVSSSAFAIATVDTPFTYRIAADFDASVASGTKTFRVENPPLRLGIDRETGVISGTPSKAGHFTIPIHVRVGNVETRATLTLLVTPHSLATAQPEILAPAGVLAFQNRPLDISFTAARATSASISEQGSDLRAFSTPSVVDGEVARLLRLTGIPGQDGSFRRIFLNASNAGGSTQAILTLSVVEPQAAAPAMLAPLSPLFVFAGQDARLAVTAAGIPEPTFRWARNGVPVEGETGSSLTLRRVSSVNSGTYTVTAANASGSASSSAILLVREALEPTPTPTPAPTPTPGPKPPAKPSDVQISDPIRVGDLVRVGVAFTDRRQLASRFAIQIRVRKPNATWTAWTVVNRIEAVDAAGDYAASLNLKPRTTYQLRIVAYNAAGSAVSRVFTLKIPELPSRRRSVVP